MWIHNSTSCGRARQKPTAPRVSVHKACTCRWANPKKHRHLRAFSRPLYCCHAAWREGSGPGVSATPSRRVRAEIPGRPPTQTRAQAAGDPGARSPARIGGACRVPHPRRRGASTCSAEGRSAIRSEPQHPHRRTLRPGQAAWGWKPELLFALPSDASVNRWRQDEERREQSPGSG